MSSSSSSPEVCLGSADVVPVGTGRAFVVGERTIAVFRSPDGTLHATQDSCPHAGSSLAEGHLGTTNIICPRHGWKFNLKSGVCAHDPGYRLRVYEVREEGGEIYVKLG